MAKTKFMRIARLVELMMLIKSHPDWGPKRLATYFEISEKRLYDDLNELNAANIPIVYNGSGYSFLNRPTSFLIGLTIDETLALWLAASMLRRRRGDVFTPTLNSASTKLLDTLPPEVATRITELAGKVVVASVESANDISELLQALNGAIADRSRLSIVYYTYSRNDVSERAVDPYGVFHHGNSWYLVAYCHNRNEIRTFRVNRIRSLERMDDLFEYPENFSINEYLEGTWGVFSGEEVTIRLLFSRKLAPLIEETIWHSDQKIEKLDDGSVLLTAQVRGMLDIRRWVMSWGDGVTVLEPVELREEIAAHARAMYEANMKVNCPGRIHVITVFEMQGRAPHPAVE